MPHGMFQISQNISCSRNPASFGRPWSCIKAACTKSVGKAKRCWSGILTPFKQCTRSCGIALQADNCLLC